MRESSFEELSKKEVISCLDCSRLGFIVDLNIQLENAQIISVTIEEPSGLFNFFKRKTLTIPWDCIRKIGDDLIIADYIKPIDNNGNQNTDSNKNGIFKGLFKN